MSFIRRIYRERSIFMDEETGVSLMTMQDSTVSLIMNHKIPELKISLDLSPSDFLLFSQIRSM